MKRIFIEQWPQVLACGNGSILDTALKAGVPYPHQCRSGDCGECKTQLLKGRVRQYPCLSDALSADERAENIILACRSQPITDLEIRWLGDEYAARFQRRKIKASVLSLDKVSRTVVRLVIEPVGQPLEFAAGQYLRLRIGDLPPRSYSMANLPGTSTIELHIALVEGGCVSGYIGSKLRPDDMVEIEGPFGASYLRADKTGPLLAVAGATGLAPILSIIKASLKGNPARDIYLYHGVRDQSDLYAKTDLERLSADHDKVRISAVLSEPAGHPRYRTGFVHQAFDADFGNLPDGCLYTAGPTKMVDAVKLVAKTKGLSDERIHCDSFFQEPTHAPPAKNSLKNRLAALFTG